MTDPLPRDDSAESPPPLGRGVTRTLPASPAYLVSDNRRIHWSERYRVQQYWRGYALLMFRNVGRTTRYERAHVTITFRFPNNRRRDVHNLMRLVCKPIVDGIVGAGLLPDDDDTHLVGPDVRRDPENGPYRVTVTVECPSGCDPPGVQPGTA